VDGTGGDYAERNKSIRERQLSYHFTYTWNIRNSTEDHRGREGKLKGKSLERKTNHERLFNYRKQTEGHWRGGT